MSRLIEELALQMSGGDVPLAIAAGIDDPQPDWH